MTDLENTLRTEAAGSIGLPVYAERLSRLAALLARTGNIEEASQIIANIRSMPNESVNTRSVLLLMIAESQVEYYRDFDSKSLDRIKRAYLLSKQSGVHDLEVCAASHYLHIAYNFSKFDQGKDCLASLVKYSELATDSERARVLTVIADASQYIGDWGRARTFYDAARSHSRAAHDGTMTSSIEYNRLVSGLARLRVNSFLKRSEAVLEDRAWSVEVESVANIHSGYDNRAMLQLIDLCRARYLQFSGEFMPAAAIICRLIEAGAAKACGLTDSSLRTEESWCLLGAGLIDQVSNRVIALDLEELGYLDPDDQIALLVMLQHLRDAIGSNLDDDNLEAVLVDSKEQYESSVAEIRSMIQGITVDSISIRPGI